MTYQPFIGLEVHVELATKSKMFCGCPAEHFGVTPNTHTCPVCLGLPGALPVPNKKAVEWTILLGLALGCKINAESKFDRKNYFYPDLPKGYQITQYDQPFCFDGKLDGIRICRVHLEEDTGKLQHLNDMTLVDFNRSGVPLVEVVTEPDFRSIDQVDIFLKKLQRIIRYLEISGADMEKGSMRLEPSISLSTDGKLPSYRVELKNINSFRFARKALEYEIKRQQQEKPVQQTRGWSEQKGVTLPQREKEEAHDYRYFPEPDIPPMKFSDRQISDIRSQVQELPDAKLTRFVKDYGISKYAANILVDDKTTANYFEQATRVSPDDVVDIANWVVNKKVDIDAIVPAQLVAQIRQSKKTSLIDKKELEKVVDEILASNPQTLVDYKQGKVQVIGFLLGQIAKKTDQPVTKDLKSLIEKELNDRN